MSDFIKTLQATGRLKKELKENWESLSEKDKEVVIKDIGGISRYLRKRGVIG